MSRVTKKDRRGRRPGVTDDVRQRFLRAGLGKITDAEVARRLTAAGSRVSRARVQAVRRALGIPVDQGAIEEAQQVGGRNRWRENTELCSDVGHDLSEGAIAVGMIGRVKCARCGHSVVTNWHAPIAQRHRRREVETSGAWVCSCVSCRLERARENTAHPAAQPT